MKTFKRGDIRNKSWLAQIDTAMSAGIVSKVKKPNKFGAKGFYDEKGQYFHSKGEHWRWRTLEILQDAGEISELERQKKFDLIINGENVGTYTCDFYYRENRENGEYIIEDFKGYFSPAQKFRIRVAEACLMRKIKITQK